MGGPKTFDPYSVRRGDHLGLKGTVEAVEHRQDGHWFRLGEDAKWNHRPAPRCWATPTTAAFTITVFT